MHGSDGGTWHPALAWRASRASAEASGARDRALRILHVTPYYHDAWAYGGIPRVVSALARAQARLGHAVTVCTTDAGTERRLEHPDGQRPRLRPWSALGADGLRIHVFPNVSNRLAYNQLFMPMGLSAFLRRHAGSFDVAHLHACRNIPGVVAAHAMRRARVPYVLAPNGTAPRIERRLGAKRLFDLVAGRRVLESARRVLAVTEIERRQLETLGVPARRLRVIGNPIDLDEFQVARAGDAFRERAGVGTAPLILFLGKLTPRKRVDVVVRAFAALDVAGARLVLAGNDMGAGARILQLVDECNRRERVRFTGLLAGRDRLDALAAADVVVYPSADEIFGLVPLEALLCGRPVIVGDDSGCAEVLRDVEGTLAVPLGDPYALRQAISEGLASQAWRSAAVAGGARIASRYGSRRIAELVDAMYREILGPAIARRTDA